MTYSSRRTPRRGLAILVERLWSAPAKRRECQMDREDLRGFSESELKDIRTTRGEIDDVASQQKNGRPYRSTGCGGALVFLLLTSACILASSYEATAGCSAQDVLRAHLAGKTAPLATGAEIEVGRSAARPVWKTITLGTFRDTTTLLNAMDAMGCGIGNSAAEVLARPAFTVSNRKMTIELFRMSATELGFKSETASLREIYEHAQRFGFELAPAEVAPQLRLQYLDQPIGEFLIIAMEPIRTWAGEPIILTVANGGAGLILIGQEGQDEADVSATSRFVFARRDKTVPTEAAHVAH